MSDPFLLPTFLMWFTLATVVSWAVPRPAQAIAVAVCGACMLGSIAPLSLLLLGTATLVSFALHRRGLLASTRLLRSCVAAIALAYFWLVLKGSGGDAHARHALLPLGLAYYSLRLVHYLFESHKGALRAHGFGEVLAYQLFPPVLPVGPIHRFNDFLRDLRRRRWDAAQLSNGSERILYGLAKIVVLGALLNGAALPLLPPLPPLELGEGATLYLGVLGYWLELYVIFSGYSDLAIGFGALMGFRLCENFNWPFLASNISEFWQRWHMSLSSWCRDYVYLPILAGSRSTLLAALGSMVVLGVWHDVSLQYLLWGVYHGLGIVAYRWFAHRYAGVIAQRERPLVLAWRVLGVIVTLHFVSFSFSVTRALERWITAA